MESEEKRLEWCLDELSYNLPSEGGLTGVVSIQATCEKSFELRNVRTNSTIRKFAISESGDIAFSHWWQHDHIHAFYYTFSILHEGKYKDIIPEHALFHNIGTTYLKDSTEEILIIAGQDGCRSWKVAEYLAKPGKHKTLSLAEVNICAFDNAFLACVSTKPLLDTGRHNIDVLEMENEKWCSTRTIRFKLDWGFVYDMCIINSSHGPLLVMCSWQNEIVSAVGLHDGKMKWTTNTEKAGIKLDAISVCADGSGRLFVALRDRYSIYGLSPEDGSIISRLELSPPILLPKCIRIHQGMLCVAHVDKEMINATKEKRWKVSMYIV